MHLPAQAQGALSMRRQMSSPEAKNQMLLFLAILPQHSEPLHTLICFFGTAAITAKADQRSPRARSNANPRLSIPARNFVVIVVVADAVVFGPSWSEPT
jgi:hypothetical protein